MQRPHAKVQMTEPRQRLAPGCCHCSLFRVAAQAYLLTAPVRNCQRLQHCCIAWLSVTAAVQTFLHTWSALARSMAKPALSHTLAKHGTATFQNLKHCLNSQHHFNCIAIGILQDLSFKRTPFPKFPFSPLSKDYDLCRVQVRNILKYIFSV